jgi:hypothetical protein
VFTRVGDGDELLILSTFKYNITLQQCGLINCFSNLMLSICILGQPLGIYNEVDETDHFADKDPPSEDTRELQKIMPGISKAQIQQILFFTQQQRVKLNHGHKNIDLNDSVISIFTVIKMILFAGLLSWLVFVLNRDYGNIVTIWFVRTFPRESSTFGLSLKNEL